MVASLQLQQAALSSAGGKERLKAAPTSGRSYCEGFGVGEAGVDEAGGGDGDDFAEGVAVAGGGDAGLTVAAGVEAGVAGAGELGAGVVGVGVAGTGVLGTGVAGGGFGLV